MAWPVIVKLACYVETSLDTAVREREAEIGRVQRQLARLGGQVAGWVGQAQDVAPR